VTKFNTTLLDRHLYFAIAAHRPINRCVAAVWRIQFVPTGFGVNPKTGLGLLVIGFFVCPHIEISGGFRGGPSRLLLSFGRRTDAVIHGHVS